MNGPRYTPGPQVREAREEQAQGPTPPSVVITPDRYTKAFKASDSIEDWPLLPCLPLDEALEREWETDAGFQPAGSAVFQQTGRGVRLSTKSLEAFPGEAAPMVRAVVLDVDLQDQEWIPDREHGRTFWTPERHELYEAKYEKLCAEAQPWASYHTRKGLRLIWLPSDPIPVAEYGPRYIGWVQYVEQICGLQADPQAKDWPRLFRLPKVVRDHKPTWTESYFQLNFERQNSLVLDWAGITPAIGAPRSVSLPSLRSEQPKETEAELLIWKDVNTREKPTEWGNEAKKQLKAAKGRAFFACFGGENHIPPGQRDDTLLLIVNEIFRVVKGCDPKHAYGMLMPILRRLDTDQDWFGIAWEKCCRAYEHRLDVLQKQRANFGDTLEAIREQWTFVDPLCPNQVDMQGGDDSREYCEQRLILSTGNTYYVADRAGRYPDVPVSRDQLGSQVRVNLGKVAPFLEGLNHTELTREFSYNCPGDVIYSSHVNTPTVVDHKGLPNLALPVHQIRRDLKPEWNDEIHEWLLMLSSGDEALIKWLACVPAVQSPMVALSLVGPPHSGKSALASAISEIWGRSPADGTVFTSSHQDQLLESPIVAVDEGFNTPAREIDLVANRFKKLCQDREFPVRPMYRAPVTVQSCLRILVTANSLDAITTLTKHEDLTRDVRDSLLERILHFRIPQRAKQWVQEKGSDYMARNGWVGSKPNRIARHILALHQEYQDEIPKWTERRLANGHTSELLDAFGTKTEQSIQVAKGIAHFLKLHENVRKLDGWVADDGYLNMAKAANAGGTYSGLDERLGGLAINHSKREIAILPMLLTDLHYEDSTDGLHKLSKMRSSRIQEAIRVLTQDEQRQKKRNVFGVVAAKSWKVLDIGALWRIYDAEGMDVPYIEEWCPTYLKPRTEEEDD